MDAFQRFTFDDLDDPAIRLVIVGGPETEAAVMVEIGLGDGWMARHAIERANGVWMVSEAREFFQTEGVARARLTARQKRKATVEQHLPRINGLIQDAFVLENKLDRLDAELDLERGPWWTRLVFDWQVSSLRSRRGRTPQVDAVEVERLVDEGLTYREIGRLLGVHRQTAYRVMARARKRQL